jgi:hypothetical protein
MSCVLFLNFSNQISSLEGLGQLWTHLSPNLDALFLGNNDIISLQRSKTNGNALNTSVKESSKFDKFECLQLN